MPEIIKVKHVSDYKLLIRFKNGKQGTVDFKEYLNKGPVFLKFKDINFFKKYYIDPETKVLCWPGGVDIDPDTLYHKATGTPLPVWMEN